jgi:hypothetical protein
MKRQITLSIMLALSVLLAPAGFPRTAQGQQPQRFRADPGVVTPGVNEMLRVTVASTRDDTITVRFRWMRYAAAGCGGAPPVCRHVVASQGASPRETLSPDDALSFDLQGTGAEVRVMVESNSRNARVNVQLIDTTTGQTTSLHSSAEVDTW